MLHWKILAFAGAAPGAAGAAGAGAGAAAAAAAGAAAAAAPDSPPAKVARAGPKWHLSLAWAGALRQSLEASPVPRPPCAWPCVSFPSVTP
jgi:hypothetical protein